MKSSILFLLALAALLLMVSRPAVADDEVVTQELARRAVPTKIPFQGFLTDDQGMPIDVATLMEVRIYDAATGGNVIWGPEGQLAAVSEGVFQIELGSIIPLNPADFQGAPALYLSIDVDGGGELTPRTQLLAVPFALSAENAESGSGSGVWATNGADVHYSSGNVGIGVATPTRELDVNGRALVRDQIAIGTTSLQQSELQIENSTGDWKIGSNDLGNGTNSNHFYIYDAASSNLALSVQRGSAFVGIGTSAPSALLDVNGDAAVQGNALVGNPSRIDTSLQLKSSTNNWIVGTKNDGNGTDGNMFYLFDPSTSNFPLTVQKGSSNVGINTRFPEKTLDVNGTAAFRQHAAIGSATIQQAELQFEASTGDWRIGSNDLGNGTNSNHFYIFDAASPKVALSVQRGSAFVGIGTVNPTTALDVTGAVTIRGGADIVEGFDTTHEEIVDPGTVMVIDPFNAGKLTVSDSAYDAKVAGVVSGAGGVQPGIKLGQDGKMDGDLPVAMTGRVYVKCTTENGAITPGDRLTTASLTGHAMKVVDRNRADGAVIGKAMSSLESGTGLVLVLVNLQ